MGQTSRSPAAAEAADRSLDPWSMDIREAMSCDSVEGGVELPAVGAGESRERLEAAGDTTWFGTDEVGLDGEADAADEMALPLPSTLPPPIVRLDMARSGSHEAALQEASTSVM